MLNSHEIYGGRGVAYVDPFSGIMLCLSLLCSSLFNSNDNKNLKFEIETDLHSKH